jgi:hypothetical protein
MHFECTVALSIFNGLFKYHMQNRSEEKKCILHFLSRQIYKVLCGQKYVMLLPCCCYSIKILFYMPIWIVWLEMRTYKTSMHFLSAMQINKWIVILDAIGWAQPLLPLKACCFFGYRLNPRSRAQCRGSLVFSVSGSVREDCCLPVFDLDRRTSFLD